MASYDRGSQLRRTFPWFGRLPIIGTAFCAFDKYIALPLERWVIDERVHKRIDEARRRNEGRTAHLRIATELGQSETDAWHLLGASGPNDSEYSGITVAATQMTHRAMGTLRIDLWHAGRPFPSILLATPSELEHLQAAPCVAVLVDDARSMHTHRVAISRAKAVFASNRGLLELGRIYHSLVLQAPNGDELVAALRAIGANKSLPRPAPPPARNRRKVLIQVDDFKQGGLEQVVTDLIGVLPHHQWDVALLVLGQAGPALELVQAGGVQVHRLGALNREESYRALLASEGPAIVNAHYSVFGADVASSLGIPFIQTIHNSYTWLDETTLRKHRSTADNTTAYICVSATVAYFAAEAMRLPAKKMIVLPNGIDTKRNAPIGHEQRLRHRTEFGFAEDDFVFANVAAISDVKAQLQLVRALARSQEKRLKLLLIGRSADAKYERIVRQAICEDLLGRQVVFAGHRGDVSECLGASDAFVLPSFWEGDSLALAEALAVGLPIIASNAGRAAELISEWGGILTPLPFSSIVDVRADTIHRYFTDDEVMVAGLARALVDTAHTSRPIQAPNQTNSRLDRHHAYARYADLFRVLTSSESTGKK